MAQARRTWPWQAVAAALVLSAAVLGGLACSEDDPVVPQTSGIEGRVTIGPTCPVEREDSPCPDRPYAASIVIEDRDGNEVATVRSGDDGRFRVDLSPGMYTLIPESPNSGGPPFARSMEVLVEPGTYADVSITYDSGIR